MEMVNRDDQSQVIVTKVEMANGMDSPPQYEMDDRPNKLEMINHNQ